MAKELCTNDNSSGSRVFYLDFLRVIAMIAVIVIHVTASRFYVPALDSPEWSTFNIYETLTKWGVPVFVMISGALFLDNEWALSYKKLFTKYIARIVTAFVVWSLFYCFTDLWIYSKKLEFGDFIYHFIKGKDHMWYLYLIVGLYLTVPILRLVAKSKKRTLYFLILSLVFTFVIPTAMIFIRQASSSTYSFIKNSLLDYSLNFHLTLGYVPYFVLGYALSKAEIGRKLELLIYALGIVGAVFTVLSNRWLALRTDSYSWTMYDYFTVNMLCESTAVFVFAKNRVSRIRSPKLRGFISRLAGLSFGVYLIHIIVLEVVERHIDTMTFNPIFSVPAITVLVLIGSLTAVAVLKIIPFVKKYLV